MNADTNVPSYADFGAPVANRYKGEVFSTHLVKKVNNWWTFRLNEFSFDGKSMLSNMGHAIVDTGTSLLCMTPTDFLTF